MVSCQEWDLESISFKVYSSKTIQRMIYTNFNIAKPKYRSKLRLIFGRFYYNLLRRALWITMDSKFAQKIQDPLPHLYYSHRTILLRKLKDVDMIYQYNKIINLKIASQKISRVVIEPGEVFSYWKLIGKPSKRKKYVEGMVLNNGTFKAGVGGGLCQMSNLIYWLVIHSPLTVVERHRHGYDVFPDSNRTQPFGSGATCFYPHGDLMVRNDTDAVFQLIINVGNEYLEGEIRSSTAPDCYYEIVEKHHEVRNQFWGGYSRHNKIYRDIFNMDGDFIQEEFVVENSAIMMYSPFLAEHNSSSSYDR